MRELAGGEVDGSSEFADIESFQHGVADLYNEIGLEPGKGSHVQDD